MRTGAVTVAGRCNRLQTGPAGLTDDLISPRALYFEHRDSCFFFSFIFFVVIQLMHFSRAPSVSLLLIHSLQSKFCHPRFRQQESLSRITEIVYGTFHSNCSQGASKSPLFMRRWCLIPESSSAAALRDKQRGAKPSDLSFAPFRV